MFSILERLKLFKSVVYTISIILAAIAFPAVQATAQTTPIPKNTKTPIGCLSGYLDGTFRGDRPITRYEFAAGLNACLEQIDRQIRERNSNLATREDFEVLIQRQRELNLELHQLNERANSFPRQRSSF